MAKQNALVISYYPLLDPRKFGVGIGEAITNAPDDFVHKFSAELEGLPSGAALAALWVSENGKPYPILLMERAQEIADHFQWWSDQKPLEWFSLFVGWDERGYAITLVPNFEKSIERWLYAQYIRTGKYESKESYEFQLLFSALRLSSKLSPTFKSLRDVLPAFMPIYLLDSTLLDVAEPIAPQLTELESKLIKLGEFPVVARGMEALQHSVTGEYLRGLLGELDGPVEQDE